MRMQGAVLFTVLVTLSACENAAAGPGNKSQAGTVSDSAGVRIVSHDLRTATNIPALPLGSAPVFSLSGEDHDFLEGVQSIEGGVILSDDRVAIGLRGGQQIVVLNTDGTVVRSIGRSGAGPGEFRRLKGPWLADGDALLAYDASMRRVTILDTTGRVLASDTYAGRSARDTIQLLWNVIGALRNGRVIGTSITTARPEPGMSRQQVQMTALDSGGITTPLGERFPGAEISVGPPNAQGFVALRQPPFGRNTLMAVCPTSLVHMANETGRIIETTEAGAITQMLDLRTTPVKIERDHFVAEALRWTDGDTSGVGRTVSMMQEMTVTEFLPVVMSLRCMRDGDLWVELYPLPSDTMTTYAVFDSGFALRGKLVLPRSHVVLDAIRGSLLIVRPGADDVAVVESRRLR